MGGGGVGRGKDQGLDIVLWLEKKRLRMWAEAWL